MPQLNLSEGNAVFYDYTPPTTDSNTQQGVTFVFYNALTGDAGMWLNEIAPALQQAGHGTLVWNFRGQANSPFTPGLALDDLLIVADASHLLHELKPSRSVLVGLSIGGLFAARTYLAGWPAAGMVLINTLRRPGPRLAWLNDAALRCAQVGGLELVKDLFGALIFNEQWLAQNHPNAFQDKLYTPLTPEQGHYRLLSDCRSANWDIPYEQLDLPALVLTGLQDDMFLDLADVANYAARLPQVQRLDMADAGHMVPLERPQAFIQALLDFARTL